MNTALITLGYAEKVIVLCTPHCNQRDVAAHFHMNLVACGPEGVEPGDKCAICALNQPA